MELEVLQHREMQLARRTAILALEERIVSEGRDVGPESCPVKHHFADGSYGREMTLPAGLVVVGKIHKHAHVNVISRGRALVFTEQEGVRELVAPCTFVSSPGTKRVVMVQEETVWTTVHVTDKTDITEIERELIAESYKEITV